MKDKDQLAFPMAMDVHSNVNEYHTGLTKREYFAGLAMQGILQNLGIADEKLAILQRQYYLEKYQNSTEFECVAKESVSMADALISALSPSTGKDKIE